MGRFLNKFKGKTSNIGDKLERYNQKKQNNPDINKKKFNLNNKSEVADFTGESEDLNEDFNETDNYDNYYGEDEVNVQQAQKPESFHRFILQNKYEDLEMDIRGYKKVWDKENQKFNIKRKPMHCFTDEEAEDIVQKAQSDLSTDIKMSIIGKDVFPHILNSIRKELERYIRCIMEYKYGRYNKFSKTGKLLKVNYELQGNMKRQAVKIFDDLYRRIYANYSVAIAGAENIRTHQNVKGQESLQSSDNDYNNRNRGYS